MQSTDLKVYKSLSNGRKSTVQVHTGVVQNVFVHVTSAQRKTGLTSYTKTHWTLTNTDNGALLDPEVYLDKPTLSPDDYVVMCLLDQRDALADLADAINAADKYGVAVLADNIAATALTFNVIVKHANLLPGGTDDIFKDGYQIKICSHSDALATDGAEESKTIFGTPTFSGLTVTITVTAAFVNNFTADATTRVSSLIKPGDIRPSYTAITKTSTNGTIDDGSFPILLDNVGTPEQDWSSDWTDGTHFTMSGDTLGVVGSGIVGTDFAPVDPNTGRPYFTISAGMLGGTWVAGDNLIFTTHPATVPIGQKRVVLPGAVSLANNRVTQVYGGEGV